jgi:DNA-binding transcriptional MerR regulator
LRYFARERALDQLRISTTQLDEFESKGIVRGTAKAGRVFYSARDMYRMKGILLFLSRGMTLEEAQQRVDSPAEVGSAARNRE